MTETDATFVFDECVGQLLAEFMQKLGFRVRYVLEFLKEGTADEVLIPKLSKRGFVVVTFDYKQTKRRQQAMLYKKHRGRGFALVVNSDRGIDKAKQLLCQWERILKKTAEMEAPFLFRVPRLGSEDSWTEVLSKEAHFF